MNDLPEHADRDESEGAYDVALHILSELQGEVALQLRPKDAVERNRWQLLKRDRAVALHGERISRRRIATGDDDDAVPRLEIARAEARSKLGCVLAEWLPLLTWRRRCIGGRFRFGGEAVELRARRYRWASWCGLSILSGNRWRRERYE